MEKYLKLHPVYASAAIVLIISIAYVSLLPLQEIPKTDIAHLDKLVHAIMYALLSLNVALGFFNLKKNQAFFFSFPIFVSFFYGFFIEIMQEWFTNYRFFDIFDIFANGIGCLIALTILNTPFFKKNKTKYI